jgi:O-methyltransferase
MFDTGARRNPTTHGTMNRLGRRFQYALQNNAEALRLKLLSIVARLLFPGYRLRFPSIEWWKNDDFNHYLKRFGELNDFNSDRRWMLHQLLRLIGTVPGDTAECGVFRGASSYLILRANSARSATHPRHHFLFDSYEGLSSSGDADGGHWQGGDLSVSVDEVERRLQGTGAFTCLKGWIPERFTEVADRTFAFVHIDVDLYEPTRDSLAFFLPRMAPGGIIVVDDLGFSTCPGARRAVEEVLGGQPEKIIELADGGGFLIKGLSPADAAVLSDASHARRTGQ